MTIRQLITWLELPKLELGVATMVSSWRHLMGFFCDGSWFFKALVGKEWNIIGVNERERETIYKGVWWVWKFKGKKLMGMNFMKYRLCHV